MSFGLSIAGGNKVKLTVHMGKIVSLKLSKKNQTADNVLLGWT